MNTSKINVASFFKDSTNVWVSENFQNIFLSKYLHSNDSQDRGVNFYDLSNMKVEVEPQGLVFQDADTFLVQLALLIQDQMNGESGKLLNDSSANYFFLKAKDGKYYSILVRWENAQKLWRCGAYLQEELKMPNIRIFYSE